MRDIAIGIVGTRNIGRKHLRDVEQLHGCHVQAIAEMDADRRQLIQTEHQIPTAYADAAELFRDESVDAVILAVPNHLHAPLSQAALQAGKHVLVEKPMAHSVAACDRMIATRDTQQHLLAVAFNQRFTPQAAAARQLVAEGAIGAVQHVRCWWNLHQPFPGLWERGDWFLSKDNAGGGPLIDLGVHKLDQALFVIGEPDIASINATCTFGIGSAFAKTLGKDYAVEDAATACYQLAQGGELICEAAYFRKSAPHAPGQGCIIEGTDGGIDLSGSWWRHDDTDVRPMDLQGDWPTCPVDHLCRVIRGEEELLITAERGRRVQALIEGAYESARIGQSIPFSANTTNTSTAGALA